MVDEQLPEDEGRGRERDPELDPQTGQEKLLVVRRGLRTALAGVDVRTNPGSGDVEILEYFSQKAGGGEVSLADDAEDDWDTYYDKFVAAVGAITGKPVEEKEPREIVDDIRQKLGI